ncbi:uncharacterized protein LOC104860538 [Fukomys damarensis]|uniref:uncharacterized protein LOC104860538 n=1 Tax=Fukomys damarensis TaxID=885580 RepID=UPI00053F3908|nr:uncharacterized protein LOC104860538 [Fukomys damarensis]
MHPDPLDEWAGGGNTAQGPAASSLIPGHPPPPWLPVGRPLPCGGHVKAWKEVGRRAGSRPPIGWAGGRPRGLKFAARSRPPPAVQGPLLLYRPSEVRRLEDMTRKLGGVAGVLLGAYIFRVGADTPTACCCFFISRKIPRKFVVDYYETSSQCPKSAVMTLPARRHHKMQSRDFGPECVTAMEMSKSSLPSMARSKASHWLAFSRGAFGFDSVPTTTTLLRLFSHLTGCMELLYWPRLIQSQEFLDKCVNNSVPTEVKNTQKQSLWGKRA